jgi:hypothetical protein
MIRFALKEEIPTSCGEYVDSNIIFGCRYNIMNSQEEHYSWEHINFNLTQGSFKFRRIPIQIILLFYFILFLNQNHMIGLILAPHRNFSQKMGGMFSEIYEIVEIEISNKIETIKESQFFFQIYVSFIFLCNVISLLTIYGFMKVNQFKNQLLELSVHYTVIFKLLQCLLLPNKITCEI